MFIDQTVLITGASAGFGEAFAEIFAQHGARLILMARRAEKLEKIAHALHQKYATDIHIVALDVSDQEAVKEKISHLPQNFSTPDLLINNAGLVRGLNKVWETSSKEWDEMIDTNVKGILNLCSAIIPKMIKANKGHIINVGSISGHDTYPGGGIYCATKFAVKALTDTLRKELVASPIRVSMVSPGMAKTEFSEVRFENDKARAEAVYKGIHPLSAQDVAEAVWFIASRPPHVTVADMVVYPTHQASVSLIHRE